MLSAIQNLQQSTKTQIDAISNRIGELEKDLADNSRDDVSLGNTVPSTVVTNTVTMSSGFGSFLSGSNVTNLGKRPLPHDDTSPSGSKPKKAKKSKKSKKKRDLLSDESSSSTPDEELLPQDQQMDDLMHEYDSSKPKYLEDPTTDDIQPQLANILETWFWSVYSKDEVKAELQKPVRPANALALIPTKINESVFRSLDKAGIQKDMTCRFIQNAFMKATQPIALAWSSVISLENHLKARGLDLEYSHEGLHVDFVQLRKHLDQGLRLLGIANSQMVVHRKDILSQYLHKDFKKLCKSHVPFDQWMFNSNLKGLLEDTIRVNRMVQQNRPPPTTPFPKKGFGRGRGFNQNQPKRGSGGFHQQRGRGYARGWQLSNNTPSPLTSKKPGSLPKPPTQKS